MNLKCPSTATFHMHVLFHKKGHGVTKNHNKNEMWELLSASPLVSIAVLYKAACICKGPTCPALGSDLHCTLVNRCFEYSRKRKDAQRDKCCEFWFTSTDLLNQEVWEDESVWNSFVCTVEPYHSYLVAVISLSPSMDYSETSQMDCCRMIKPWVYLHLFL